MTTALVVDDSPDIRLLLSTLLQSAGIEVIEAEGGPDALGILAERRPDVVLLDIQMPDMDGWQTLREIRLSSPAADVPVVLCTVKSGRGDRVRAWELACDGYLVKPFDIDVLLAEVRAVVARNAVERQALRQGRLAAVRVTASVGREETTCASFPT